MLTLGISTSSGQFAVVLGEDNQLLFDSVDGNSHSELYGMLSCGLDLCKRKIADIEHIIVDTGPGGTSRVRTGISFANSLSYSLDIPVCPVSSMELAGIDAYEKYKLPVISTVRSIKGNAYIGFFDTDKVVGIEYGKIEDLLPETVKDLSRFSVVGFHREQIINMPCMKDKTVVDSHLFFGNARIFVEKSELFLNRGVKFPVFAQPITEETL
ncbi:MAG: hypothetical protein LBL57_04390 [Tannerella sp.]|jgi:tRNA A37 threonylcarbamoyladenosine modification protein TsaB|nr:hypothetical protein [Tannerella sp.]